MLAKKYDAFQQAVKHPLQEFKQKRGTISESEFDAFTLRVLSDTSLDIDDKIYCRDGCAFIKPIDRSTFQIICFQVNSFGAGIFSEGIKKLCTPILLTIRIHGAHQYLKHSLKDACISIDEFYLGAHYSGSKGTLCDRDKFNEYAKTLFLSKSNIYSFNHQIVYQLMNANYLCHHIAEVVGYAFGALNAYWIYDEDSFFLSSGSRFNENRDKLFIDIIDNFSSEKMSGHFQIPHYAKLAGDPKKFQEEFDTLIWEVNYRKNMETFYLPVGYQAIHEKKFNKNVNVITSQHLIEHVLTDYYQRKSSFVVASTFQTLEYLSRALIAKAEGREEEFNQFLHSVTSCMGYYPEHDFMELHNKKESHYIDFVSEYSHTMFFRAPVLK